MTMKETLVGFPSYTTLYIHFVHSHPLPVVRVRSQEPTVKVGIKIYVSFTQQIHEITERMENDTWLGLTRVLHVAGFLSLLRAAVYSAEE